MPLCTHTNCEIICERDTPLGVERSIPQWMEDKLLLHEHCHSCDLSDCCLPIINVFLHLLFLPSSFNHLDASWLFHRRKQTTAV